MSHTHSRLGSVRQKSRSTRSGADGRAGSRVVVEWAGAPARGAEDPEGAHDPRDALFAHRHPVAEAQLGVDTRRTVDPEGLVVNRGDLGRKCLIGDRASARRA